jgi:predicted enzyme related to lactoylglutathione lyase
MAAPFVWFDLTTISGDSVGVQDFYTQLFGWTTGPGMGDYQGFVTDASNSGPDPARRRGERRAVDPLRRGRRPRRRR